VGCVFFGLVYRGSVTFFPALFASEVNAIAVSDNPAVYAGMLTSAVLFAGVIGQWAGGMFVEHLKRPEFGHIIIFAIAVPTLWFVGRTADTPLVVWAIAFNTVFYAWQPVQNGLVAKYTSRGARGLGYGLNFFLLMGVGSIATAIGGWIADEYGVYKIYQVLWYLAVASLAVSLLVLRFSRLRVKVKVQYEMISEDA
jgi:predicted MFS family arabinose efflux permease